MTDFGQKRDQAIARLAELCPPSRLDPGEPDECPAIVLTLPDGSEWITGDHEPEEAAQYSHEVPTARFYALAAIAKESILRLLNQLAAVERERDQLRSAVNLANIALDRMGEGREEEGQEIAELKEEVRGLREQLQALQSLRDAALAWGRKDREFRATMKAGNTVQAGVINAEHWRAQQKLEAIVDAMLREEE